MKINDFKVGLMVTGGCILFLVFHWVIKGVSFEKEGKAVLVTFPPLSGVRVGTDVKVGGGVNVGKVRTVTFQSNRAMVELWVRQDTRITSTTAISIATLSILGDKFISIDYGKEAGEPLPAGYVIQGDPGMGISGTLHEFGSLMRRFNQLLASDDGKNILGQLEQTIRTITARLDRIIKDAGDRLTGIVTKSEADLGTITRNLADSSKKLNRLLDDFSGSGRLIKETLTSLHKNSRSLETALPVLLSALQQFAGSAADILKTAKTEKTLLHLLAYDKKAYYDIMFILQNLKEFSFHLKKDPSSLLWRYQK